MWSGQVGESSQSSPPTGDCVLPAAATTVEAQSGRPLQFSASDRTRPSQPFGGRTFRMKAMVRARSTTSESPYLPALIQLGPYIASGTLVSYDHGDPWVEA